MLNTKSMRSFDENLTTTPMTFVVCSDLISKNVNCSRLL